MKNTLPEGVEQDYGGSDEIDWTIGLLTSSANLLRAIRDNSGNKPSCSI